MLETEADKGGPVSKVWTKDKAHSARMLNKGLSAMCEDDSMHTAEEWASLVDPNLKSVFHAFVAFIPFEGKPFVRKWALGLVPIMCEWMVLSARYGARREPFFNTVVYN